MFAVPRGFRILDAQGTLSYVCHFPAAVRENDDWEGRERPSPSHSFPFGPSWLISEQKVEGAGRINAFQDVKYEQSSAFRAALPLSGEDGAHSFHEIRNSGRVILPILRAG